MLIGHVDAADLLSAKTDAKDCQRLLDGLYADDLLGKPSGASRLRGFGQDDSRLLYQVDAYERTGPQESLVWLRSLPDRCDRFTATGDDGEQRTVQVVATSLPKGGLDGTEADSVEQAVKQGTHRLKDVLAGRTPPPNPSELD